MTTAIHDDTQLHLPGIDGHQIDRIAIKFAGTPDLDRTHHNTVNAYRNLKLGTPITFHNDEYGLDLHGYVISTGGTISTDPEGDVDHVQGTKTVKFVALIPTDE